MTEYKNGSELSESRCDVMIGPIKYGELKCSSAKISMTSEINASDASVKMTATITTTGYIWKSGKQTGELMNWVKYWFRLVFIRSGNESSLGIYIPQTVEKVTQGRTTAYNVTGYDKSILPLNDGITERNYIAAGTKYLDAISALIISSGITQIIADESSAVFPTARDDWDVGTSKLKIINQLLTEISFQSLKIDSNGSAVLQEYQEASAENIKHTYTEGKASLIKSDVTVSSNQLEIPNIWIATVSNADLSTPFTYKYVNDNPMSTTSTVYTGQNKIKVLSFDNIATQTDLENAVRKQAFSDMQGYETVSFETAIMPDHGVNDTVALQLSDYSGILMETEWEIDLDFMKMTHKGKRAVNY